MSQDVSPPFAGGAGGGIATARRLLVITKFRYLGDTIVATPFFRFLHAAAPQAKITLLTGPPLVRLLEGCPYLADIWPFDPKGPGRLRRNAQLISRIRQAGFDAAFLLNRSLHSAFLAFAARVPHRIGFDTEHRGPLLTLRVPYSKTRREIDCCLDLLRAIGIEAAHRLPQLWVTDAERRCARQLLCKATGEALKPPLILFQPGAKDPYKKQWETGRFAAVADGLAAVCADATFALIGAPEERTVCETMAAQSRASLVNLAGRTHLREVLALLAEADMLVANDTAMVHAAVALGTPTVTVHGPQTAGKWGYDLPRHRSVTLPDGSGPADRHANRRALDRIGPEAVLEAALAILTKDRADTSPRS